MAKLSWDWNAFRLAVIEAGIRGELTADWRAANPDVEPAHVLLERIAEEKAELIRTKQIRKEKPLPPISSDEVPFDIPSSWEWCPIGELGHTLGGLWTGKKGDLVEASVFRAANFSYECELNAKLPAVIQVEHKQLESRRLKEGDILIEKSGGGENQPVGRAVLFDYVEDNWSYSNFTVRLRLYCTEYSLPAFVHAFLFFMFRSGMTEPFQKNTTNIRNLQMTEYLSSGFPLPPQDEQQEIVRILSALGSGESDGPVHPVVARIQKLEQEFKALADEYESQEKWLADLRSALLQEAISGQLTADWRTANPNVEPAYVLLERIAEEKAELIRTKQIRKEKPLPPITPDEVPFDIPSTWEWSRLIQVCVRTGSGATPRGGKSAYVSEGVPFLRSQNVLNASLDISDVAHITEETHASMSHTEVRPNDVLLNITGGSIGRSCVVPESFVRGNVNQHVSIIRAFGNMCPDYLSGLFLSPFYQAFIETAQTGAGREGLPKGKMDLGLIPIPPETEQKEIVRRLEVQLEKVNALQEALERSKEAAQLLMKSKLAEVFEPAMAD